MKIVLVIGNGLKFGIIVIFKGNWYFYGNNKLSLFLGFFKCLFLFVKSLVYIVIYVIVCFFKVNVLLYWKWFKYIV